MITDCPHCFSTVATSADGICPSCRKNVNELADTDSSKAALNVSHGAHLPGVCCECGRTTDRFVTVKQKIRPHQNSRERARQTTPGLLILLVFTLGIVPLVILALGQVAKENLGRTDILVVRMPQCKDCGADGKPEPIRTNPETLDTTFVVHKKLQHQVVKDKTA